MSTATAALPAWIAILDGAGVVVFAITGALVASRKQMDIVGFVFLGVVTGIGGGTLRDLLLGQAPVFWVRDPTPLLLATAASIGTFFLAHLPASRLRLLLWLDAVGLALFAAVGAQKGLEHGPAVGVTMGVLTAVGGGVIRDILGGESPVILRREIYATAAMTSAVTLVLLAGRVPGETALLAAMAAGFALRALAIGRRWSLPVFRPRPPRSPDELGL